MLKTLPIILALCLMLSGAYYAKIYAGIIGLGLAAVPGLKIRITDRKLCIKVMAPQISAKIRLY